MIKQSQHCEQSFTKKWNTIALRKIHALDMEMRTLARFTIQDNDESTNSSAYFACPISEDLRIQSEHFSLSLRINNSQREHSNLNEKELCDGVLFQRYCTKLLPDAHQEKPKEDIGITPEDEDKKGLYGDMTSIQ